jgi:hypothetical protein
MRGQLTQMPTAAVEEIINQKEKAVEQYGEWTAQTLMETTPKPSGFEHFVWS